MEKVLEMLVDERKREILMRGSLSDAPIIGGLQTVPILEGSERLGYKVINIETKEEAIMAHKSIDSRLRVLGYGIDIEALEQVAIPAIEYARDEREDIHQT